MKLNLEDLKPTEAEVISNSHVNHLYKHKFGKGQFFKIVTEDEEQSTFQIAPRTQMQVKQLTKNGKIQGLKITQLVHGKISGGINLSNMGVAQLQAFLDFIVSTDLRTVTDRRSKILFAHEASIESGSLLELVAGTLSGTDGAEKLQQMLDDGMITGKDILNTGYRREQLAIFYAMLYEDYLDTYKLEVMERPNTKDETAWQHFFEQNEWIFGYGLSYRFNTILQREFAASDTDADGSGQVNADFLTADTRFTAFVELKKPNTPLFGPNRNRSGAWMLSNDLFNVHSQALQQKAAGTLKLESSRHLTGKDGEPISQRALDPQITVVIGCWSEIENENYTRRREKQQTFELFRQDTRNLTYITYDELFERAQHIVGRGVITAPIAA